MIRCRSISLTIKNDRSKRTKTTRVGLLVGGVIFSITGSSLSDKADEAWSQMKKAEREIDAICSYMKDLNGVATKFDDAITKVNRVYMDHMDRLSNVVEVLKKTDWDTFTAEEKLITENTALLVNLLFNMGKVQLVLASGNETEPNKVNTEVVNKAISDSETFLNERGLAGAF
ncbi:hypothetical protein [Geosporobacter ferrireducens]|uniref:hypothetical protein n=1 Tax=Geosporobacter ferrireducens TaxID=1424294 RepID=UPI000B14F39A|nr:hypothetical protein [Geosporobacter ferrireducens]